jgi:uncharacterized protein (TIGR02594 family)
MDKQKVLKTISDIMEKSRQFIIQLDSLRNQIDDNSTELIPWFELAKTQLGQKEIPGKEDNQQIVDYLMATNYREPTMHDEIPWCAAFVTWCLKHSGYSPCKELQAWAPSYDSYGSPSTILFRGSIVTLKRKGDSRSHHVCFFDHMEGDMMVCLGGNQSNSVCYSKYSKEELNSIRWPVKA